MKKLVLGIKNLKLSVKLSIIISVTCIVMLIIEIAGRQSVYDVYDEQLYQKTVQLCIAYSGQLEKEIERIEDISFSVIGDLNLQEKLLNATSDEVDYYERNDIRDSLISMRNMAGDDVIISIYLPDESWVTSNMGQQGIEDYVEVAKENQGKMSVFAKDNTIGVFREIRQIKGLTMEHMGVLFVMTNMDLIMRNIEYNYKKINIIPEVYIFDTEECIYSSSVAKQNLPPNTEKVILLNNQLIVPYTSSRLGWKIILSVPYKEINESIKLASVNATITCVLMAMIVCMCSVSLVCSLLPHINYLLKKFEVFGMGEIPKAQDYPSYEGRTDEFGQLHVRFDKMAQEYQLLTQKVYQSMVLLKDAQFKQLQQQIRPHFLFNTLSMIVWTAEENNVAETAKIAEALGRILRKSLKNTNGLVTVREEVNLVRDYLYIQQVRYSERLVVEEMIEDDIFDAEIPLFTIQPIVENVIIHVLENSLDVCVIKLSVKKGNGLVEITVEDNGGELDENILRNLENGTVLPKGNGVGLSNVDARIKLTFSEEYGLSILNTEGSSKVKVCIPYREGSDDE